MCGIVGYLGNKSALPIILKGLERLEYRGYDSAGVALVDNCGKVHITKAKGKLAELKELLDQVKELDHYATTGIGHTRWATHGEPNQQNAHPHQIDRVTLIHNGIIENYSELREELKLKGADFKSETDSEVAAHIINSEFNKNEDPLISFTNSCKKLKGSYAILALDKETPNSLFIAKTATPIIIGIGEKEFIVASDIPAILEITRNIIILEDGDIVLLNESGVAITNNGEPVSRPIQHISWDLKTAQKGGYQHFMLKEIHEQALAISDTLRGRVIEVKSELEINELNYILDNHEKFNRVLMVGCGSARHASLIGKKYFEDFAKLPTRTEYASEFRYGSEIIDDKTLLVAVSQSGETADTLAAVTENCLTSSTIAICNVVGSTLTRKTAATIYTHAGSEISVASTKAFTSQITACYLLALALGIKRKTIEDKTKRELIRNILLLPSAINQVLKNSEQIATIAKEYSKANSFMFLGRGILYPVALEGALKLKEISYIFAEGYPAGEIKHGPLALVEKDMPIVVLLPNDKLIFTKTFSNLREVHTRGAKIIVVTDAEITTELQDFSDQIIKVSYISEYLSPILMTIPLQLLAYFIATQKGTDVDLPRNLAKSVTVE
jgi:glutamine---fructose-6-phosphate transaminase (isomerizing)